MTEQERGIDPTEALIAMQQFASNEVARFYMEISMRDAFIKQLQNRIQELESGKEEKDG